MPAAAYQPISIHGTLPRRKRGGANFANGNYTWNARANHLQQNPCGNMSLAQGHLHQPVTSPLAHDVSEDFLGFR